ncbi:MAG: hypothetical protein AAB443_01010 [Patescibacteria group bacterium]
MGALFTIRVVKNRYEAIQLVEDEDHPDVIVWPTRPEVELLFKRNPKGTCLKALKQGMPKTASFEIILVSENEHPGLRLFGVSIKSLIEALKDSGSFEDAP